MPKYKTCMRCKEITEYWMLAEVYDKKRDTHLEVCPACLKKHYKDQEVG